MKIRWIILISVAALYGTVSCGRPSTTGTAETCSRFAGAPVLFVHGSGMGPGTFDRMIRDFESGGYPSSHLYAVDLDPPAGDNVRAAAAIKDAVEALLEASRTAKLAAECAAPPAEKVDLVAHSMGAFSARWYAAFAQPDRVRRLVSIAGANHGTDALCGRPGKGNRQMCPAFSERKGPDDIQYRLNGTTDDPVDETPYGSGRDARQRERVAPTEARRIEYFTVSIADDSWIVPPESALLDGAGSAAFDVDLDGLRFERLSQGNFRYLGSTGHDDLPSDPAVISFVLTLLAPPDRPSPELRQREAGVDAASARLSAYCKTRTKPPPGRMTPAPVRGTIHGHCGTALQLPYNAIRS